ncbi:hypothetical protein ACET3X_009480 [Alternaria dauci]|uniref:Uncharacterized protein n=1 Tax=Alternaria dauci TaxID=48095 RepID=A0ABR3UAH9_9PLEO
MDTLDPLLFNFIGKNREVIVYDSFGIGHSGGSVPETIEAMASIAVKFLAATNLTKVDLILAGTQSAIGEAVVLPQREVVEGAGANDNLPPTKEDMMFLFFYPSESSLALGDKWWAKIHERKKEGEERKAYLVGTGAKAQLAAIFSFTVDDSKFDRLKDIKAPTLITNGHTDVMLPTPNSFVLQQEIANAHLILYPDAGHGHLFQVPELYAKHLEIFLADD